MPLLQLKIPKPEPSDPSWPNQFQDPLFSCFKYPPNAAITCICPGITYGILYDKFQPGTGLYYGIVFTILSMTVYLSILMIPSFIFFGSNPFFSVACYLLIFYLIFVLRSRIQKDRKISSNYRDDLVYSYCCPLCILCQGANEYNINVNFCCQAVVINDEYEDDDIAVQNPRQFAISRIPELETIVIRNDIENTRREDSRQFETIMV